ncbi:MAG: Fe-S oxidoreductase [Herbaspirillum sp.]|nr:Fe-S oxidoreductase [Herbaspirillum sp.]
MNNLFLAATASSPEVDFRFDEHQLSLKGESYPENAAFFWGGIIAGLREYLTQDNGVTPISAHVALAYFNSSSTKMLFALFGALNEKAKAGTPVILNWYHDEDDDTIFEFGQELREDFPALTFHDCATKS